MEQYRGRCENDFNACGELQRLRAGPGPAGDAELAEGWLRGKVHLAVGGEVMFMPPVYFVWTITNEIYMGAKKFLYCAWLQAHPITGEAMVTEQLVLVRPSMTICLRKSHMPPYMNLRACSLWRSRDAAACLCMARPALRWGRLPSDDLVPFEHTT